MNRLVLQVINFLLVVFRYITDNVWTIIWQHRLLVVRHALFGKVSLRRLPPTSDAVRFHIMRVHYQTAIWEIANIADMELPAATESGWHLDGNVLIPVLTTLQPIPKACTAFVTCCCKKNACSRWLQSGGCNLGVYFDSQLDFKQYITITCRMCYLYYWLKGMLWRDVRLAERDVTTWCTVGWKWCYDVTYCLPKGMWWRDLLLAGRDITTWRTAVWKGC